VATSGAPHLKDFFDAMLKRGPWPRFSPFADFLLLALASSSCGSDDADWIRLTEGQKVAMPKAKQAEGGPSQLDAVNSPPTPRHTLRLTIRSTLPEVG
jgi:hypothetical protein